MRKRQISFAIKRRKLDVEREEDRLGVYEVTRGIVKQIAREQEPAHESTTKTAILSKPEISESPEPRYP
jgi:hypothetical protein